MRAFAFCLFIASCTNSTECDCPPDGSIVLTARWGHAMAFDETRNQLLLFGGFGPSESTTTQVDHRSLWQWNGATWTRLTDVGPPARHQASMVYDVARQRIVLYGGLTGQFPNETIRTDTWEFDGLAWTERATTGPSPRVHQSMAYDRVRNRVVLYGGFSVVANQELRDVWEWNGTAWTLTTASVPSDRIARNAAFVEEAPSRLMLLSVPTGGGAVITDVWDGASVGSPALSGPSCAPAPSALTSLGAGGLLFFGCAGPAGAQWWRFTAGAWTEQTGAPPPARSGHALAFDRARQVTVLYGGVNSSNAVVNETWELSGTTWTQRAGEVPPPLSVGGTYPTVVTMVADSCAGTVIMNNPTVVTHTPGASTFSLTHTAVQGSGTVANNGAFSMPTILLPFNGVNYHIDVAGTFAVTGFDALVHLSKGDPGDPNRCGYTVRWQGTKQGSPNVIPG